MEEKLSREEILEKSRQENRKGDERERTIRVEGESFSLLFVFLMGLVLLFWKRAHGLPDEARKMFAEEFSTNDIWQHFKAVQEGRVYDLDSDLFNMSANFSYEEALKALQPMLYGEE